MLRDIRLEDGGERWESHSFSCRMGLVARVRTSRAYVCSASSLGTNIWSAESLGSVSGERWAVMADIIGELVLRSRKLRGIVTQTRTALQVTGYRLTYRLT